MKLVIFNIKDKKTTELGNLSKSDQYVEFNWAMDGTYYTLHMTYQEFIDYSTSLIELSKKYCASCRLLELESA